MDRSGQTPDRRLLSEPDGQRPPACLVMYVSATNERNISTPDLPLISAVRVPLRSTPFTQEATSAMSAVASSTSRRVSPSKEGGAIMPSPTARTADAARSSISVHAVWGCRLWALNRLRDSLVTTARQSGATLAISAEVTESPLISAMGTPRSAATSALIPLSPTYSPFNRTPLITSGL